MRWPPSLFFQVLRSEIFGFLWRVGAVLPEALADGWIVTSWFRTFAANLADKGKRDSQHLVGLALDLAGPPVGNTAKVARLLDALRSVGLVAVDETDGPRPHVHVQAYRRTSKPASVEIWTMLAEYL